jgi:restriction system protein
MTTQVGQLQITRGARSVTYSVEVVHRGLYKHRLIRGSDLQVVQNKVATQVAEWDELWARRNAVTQRVTASYQAKEAKRLHIEGQKEEAEDRTRDAQAAIDAIQTVLPSSLEKSAEVDFDSLKDRTSFPKHRPKQPTHPSIPVTSPIPEQPDRSALRYRPQLSLIDKVISSRRGQKEKDAEELYSRDSQAWEADRQRIVAANSVMLEEHEKRLQSMNSAHAEAVAEWEAEKAAYTAERNAQHDSIDAFRQRYEGKNATAITEYCELVLARSEYPDCVPKEFELDFTDDTGVLVVNYRLPAPDDLPRLTEVRYVQSTDSFKESFLSEANAAKTYDDLIYQIALRTINELLEADRLGALTSVVFNGFVTATDKGTGNEVTACIVSVQATKQALSSINLAKVDAKACFRQLKGVGSSKLHSVTPVAPIINLRREDNRFIPSYGVTERLDEGYNLAAMDWEDFEHLIREIFEKEFTSSGGEVRVTQASRDGGVDAVAFDPDPIRGGKIVIQAKRYAHTVGVSAVRDLYGTLMNEGATKGILVTTSDYGPDAYEFANGKPITLLNGSNLLHLLAKHGTQAHINLVEARQIAMGKPNVSA